MEWLRWLSARFLVIVPTAGAVVVSLGSGHDSPWTTAGVAGLVALVSVLMWRALAYRH